MLVHPDDQAFHRFLWRKNQSDPSTVYQWLRLNFGDKPAPDIALNEINTLAKASKRELPEAAKELQERTYVDDIGGYRPTAAEAKHVTTTIDEVLGKSQARRHIRPKKRLSCEKERRFHKVIVPHPVGPYWDPIGLVAPVTIKYRIDLKELWSIGYGWDDILLEAIQQEWKENEEAINQLLTFKFDRKLKPDHAIGPPQVHGFADGGELENGAAIFLHQALCRPAETENHSLT